MRMLVDYCLVEAQPGTGRYIVRVCVHDWVLNGLNHDISVTRYWLAFDCVANSIRIDDWDILSAQKYCRLTTHAMRLKRDCFRSVADREESLQTRLHEVSAVAELLIKQNQYKEAQQMYQRAVAGCEKALGPEQTSTLDTVTGLGSLYGAQDKLAAAEQMPQRAAAGREKELWPEHTSALDTVNNLGALYPDQGKMMTLLLDRASRLRYCSTLNNESSSKSSQT